MIVRVEPESTGVLVEFVGIPVHVSRTEAHALAIALLQACIPPATGATISLQHGCPLDPDARWSAGWK